MNTRIFELDYKIPLDMQNGNWWIGSMIVYDKAENHKVISNLDSTKYNFNVKASYKGTENKDIKKGEEFNLLKGVTFVII